MDSILEARHIVPALAIMFVLLLAYKVVTW